jgi:hypothetical protein
VQVILLPGATKDDIPDELLGMSERFVVVVFDERGLDNLLRSLHRKPLDRKPPLGPLPALPPRFIAEVEGATASDEAHSNASPPEVRPSQPGKVDAEHDARALGVRLSQIDEQLLSRDQEIDEETSSPPDGGAGQLQRERQGLQASLDALDRLTGDPDESTLAAVNGYMARRKTLAVGAGLAVLSLIVALLITLFVGPSSGPRATFDQLANGSTVSVTQIVSGHASGIQFKSGWRLWLVIYDPGGKRHYPQQSPGPGPLTVRDGSFQGTAYFDPTSVGAYTMQLVLADPAGSSQLANYITQAKATVPVKYAGLRKLPLGAQRVLDSRQVIRRQ